MCPRSEEGGEKEILQQGRTWRSRGNVSSTALCEDALLYVQRSHECVHVVEEEQGLRAAPQTGVRRASSQLQLRPALLCDTGEAVPISKLVFLEARTIWSQGVVSSTTDGWI